MSAVLSETVVGKIVAKQPATARVFEKYQIDYCCQGNTTLVDACKRQKVDIDQVVSEIEQVQNTGVTEHDPDWNETSLTELANHIVNTHHAFMASELPRISGLIEQVSNAHGQQQPELANVAEVFQMLRQELESHMDKEENILFPAIRAMEPSKSPQAFPFGSVANPIHAMEHEHDEAGNALRRLRELTGDFKPPANACPTYMVMLESLENLERDLHLHIHKENNILFPRAKELEQKLCRN